MSLNLFPARVPIGQVAMPDGSQLDVMASPEFLRALWALFERVGGADATDNSDLFLLAMQSLMSQPAAMAMPDTVGLQQMDFGISTEIAALRQQVAQLAQLVSAPSEPVVQQNYSDFLQAYAAPAMSMDWERPGKIGAKRANTGKFTTLTASSAVTLSPANANVTLSPTGTGVVTIAPATAGSINNVNIGAATAGTGSFTTLTASSAVTLSPANANVVLSPTGTGVVTISPSTVGSINKMNIGAVTPGTAAFTTLSTTGNTTVGGTLGVTGSSTIGNASAVTTEIINGTNSGAGGGAYSAVQNGGSFVFALGNYSAINGGAYDATPTIYYPTNIIFSRAGTTTGEIFNSRLVMGPAPTDPGGTVYLKSMGGIQAVTGFGCNSKTPQTAVASGGALAAYGAGANGLDTGANMSALHALVVSIRSALVANGIMS